MEQVPKVILRNRGHIVEITQLKLLPTNLTVPVEVHSLELTLQLAHQLVLHEVVGYEDRDGRLKLVHFAEIANRLKFTARVQLIAAQFTALPHPGMS